MSKLVSPNSGTQVWVLLLALAAIFAGVVAAVVSMMVSTPPTIVHVPIASDGVPTPVPADGLVKTVAGVLTQRDTVTPRSNAFGNVNFPLPFNAPPHLKLKCVAREYRALLVTEAGFSWEAKLRNTDFKSDKKEDSIAVLLTRKLTQIVDDLRPDAQFEDFTWEAHGQPFDPLSAATKPFEQQGTFSAPKDQEAIVFFPIPYGSPPHVQVDDTHIVVTECTEKSFKWKNVGSSSFAATVKWTARGLRAKP